MKAVRNWFVNAFGIVRIRQFLDGLEHRLSFIPGLYVIGSIVVVQAMLIIDRNVDGSSLPDILTTTVDSARSVFGAMAGGLITSITLLLSMMLITIQLASGQFSPRTLRDWLGDRLLQHMIGLVLGTTVYCLLALRSTRTFGEGDDVTEIIPHFTLLLALALGVGSLFGVVRSVDHITHSVRVGSVSRRIANETISVIETADELRSAQQPGSVPSPSVDRTEPDIPDIPPTAGAIETPTAGWVQQIDEDMILRAMPADSDGYITAALGAFIPKHAPLMWIDPAPADDDQCRIDILSAFATGDSRTLQQDVAFGLVQLTDIAVRALSPGINDPSTASDIVVQIGNVMLVMWERPNAPVERSEQGRRIVRTQPGHGEHLHRALDPIRRYGLGDPDVIGTIVRTLGILRSEVIRRGLPGPLAPIDEMIDSIESTTDRTGWSDNETTTLERLFAQHHNDRSNETTE